MSIISLIFSATSSPPTTQSPYFALPSIIALAKAPQLGKPHLPQFCFGRTFTISTSLELSTILNFFDAQARINANIKERIAITNAAAKILFILSSLQTPQKPKPITRLLSEQEERLLMPPEHLPNPAFP